MVEESGNKQPKHEGWLTPTTTLLTAIAALLTALGFSQFFPNLMQRFLPAASTSESRQTEVKSDEMVEVKFNVYEQNYKPIEQVEVRFIFNGAPAPRYTDSNGYVSIEVPKREDIEVILSKDGFQTKRQIINLQADPSRTITVYLQPTGNTEAASTSQLPAPDADAEVVSENSAPLGIVQMMPYAEAGRILLSRGWQAKIPASMGQFPDLENPLINYLFSEKGYREVVHCMSTGLGLCTLEFTNENGETLVVTTSNNEPRAAEQGYEISVFGWSVEK